MRTDAWGFRNPTEIRFGAGRLAEVAELVAGRPLLITTAGASRRGLTSKVAGLLPDLEIHDRVEANPTTAQVEDAIAAWRGREIGTIVAIGGGSVIDVAKVLGLALAVDDFDLVAATEPNHPWADVRPLRCIALPTTAGTGAEVTPTATVWDATQRRKHSVAAAHLFPAIAIVDPELATTQPWDVTLSTGLDAYSQCFEAILNRSAGAVSTAVAERGLTLVPDALRILARDANDLGARTAMAEAALMSGLAISQTRTGLAHSISYPLTAHLGLPHGLACAAALPAVIDFNVETDDGRLARIAARAGLSGPREVAPSVRSLFAELGVREHVRRWVAEPSAVRGLAPEMFTPGRADNNIRPVDQAGLLSVLADVEQWLAAGDEPA